MATIDKIRLNGTDYDIIDSSAIHSLDGYAKTDEVTSAITAATAALSESFDETLEGYVTNDELTAYTYDKATIDSKVGDAFDSDNYYDKDAVDGKLATKVDTTAFTEYKGEVTAALADKLEADDVADYFDGASYNDSTKNIEFTHDGTVKATVSALPFIKDGMVENVEVKDGKLVITFNTDAGKEAIELEITDIFNASNYYTKEQADKQFGTLTEQTQLRSDVEDALGEIASLEADKQDKLTGGYIHNARKNEYLGYEQAIFFDVKNFDGTDADTIAVELMKINGEGLVQSGNLQLATKEELSATTASVETVKTELMAEIAKKADASALNDYQTKEDASSEHAAIEAKIAAKADKGEAYTKAESDAKYAEKAKVEGTTLVLG